MKVYLVILKCYMLDDKYPRQFVQGVYEEEVDAQKYIDNFYPQALPIDTDKPYKLAILPYTIIEHRPNPKRK